MVISLSVSSKVSPEVILPSQPKIKSFSLPSIQNSRSFTSAPHHFFYFLFIHLFIYSLIPINIYYATSHKYLQEQCTQLQFMISQRKEFHYKSVKGKDASCLEGIPDYISERKGILCKIGDILAKEQVICKLMYHEIWRTTCQKERTACIKVQR